MTLPTPAGNTIEAALTRTDRFYRLRETPALVAPGNKPPIYEVGIACSAVYVGPASLMDKYIISYPDLGTGTIRDFEISPKSPAVIPLPPPTPIFDSTQSQLVITTISPGRVFDTSIAGSEQGVPVSSVPLDVIFFFAPPTSPIPLVRPSVLKRALRVLLTPADGVLPVIYQFAFGRKRLHALLRLGAGTDSMDWSINGVKESNQVSAAFKVSLASGTIVAGGGTVPVDVETLNYDAVEVTVKNNGAMGSIGPISVDLELMDNDY